MAHTCNPELGRYKQDQEFKTCPGYIVNPRTAWLHKTLSCFFFKKKLVGYTQDDSVSDRVEKNHTVGLQATCLIRD